MAFHLKHASNTNNRTSTQIIKNKKALPPSPSLNPHSQNLLDAIPKIRTPKPDVPFDLILETRSHASPTLRPPRSRSTMTHDQKKIPGKATLACGPHPPKDEPVEAIPQHPTSAQIRRTRSLARASITLLLPVRRNTAKPRHR